jgi:dTMP kinase
MPGKLIVIEGIDGAGTTTQAKMITSHLSFVGYKAINSAEPTKSAIGQEIRRMLAQSLEKEPDMLVSLALCFAADRMQHIHELILPSLNKCDFVILDRYVLSSLVYQGLHLPTSFVKEINQFALKPDLTIILDVEASLAHERLSRRVLAKDFYENADMLEKIRGRYLHFAKDDPTNTVLIDGSDSVDQVQSHIWHVLSQRFNLRA